MIRLFTAAMLLAASGAAFGAPPTPTQMVPERASTNRTTDTPADRFGFFEGQQLQVSTGTDDDNLTFRIALPAAPSMADRFSLKVSTPLHGADNAMPASLDALANGTKVTLSWGHFGFPTFHPDDTARTISQRAQTACRQAEPGQINCDDTGYATRHHARRLYPQYLRHSLSNATDFGVEATVGINDFEWTDPTTGMAQQMRHTDWSAAAHLDLYLPGTQTAFAFSGSYQRAYKAAEEQQYCPPNAAPAACVTTRIAAPTREENLLLSAGVRHRVLGNGILLNLAVAPVVTYEVLDDVWGVDVPVYFMPGENNTLTGGIRFGYRSDRDDKFTIGVFVGQAF